VPFMFALKRAVFLFAPPFVQGVPRYLDDEPDSFTNSWRPLDGPGQSAAV